MRRCWALARSQAALAFALPPTCTRLAILFAVAGGSQGGSTLALDCRSGHQIQDVQPVLFSSGDSIVLPEALRLTSLRSASSYSQLNFTGS